MRTSNTVKKRITALIPNQWETEQLKLYLKSSCIINCYRNHSTSDYNLLRQIIKTFDFLHPSRRKISTSNKNFKNPTAGLGVRCCYGLCGMCPSITKHTSIKQPMIGCWVVTVTLGMTAHICHSKLVNDRILYSDDVHAPVTISYLSKKIRYSLYREKLFWREKLARCEILETFWYNVQYSIWKTNHHKQKKNGETYLFTTFMVVKLSIK